MRCRYINNYIYIIRITILYIYCSICCVHSYVHAANTTYLAFSLLDMNYTCVAAVGMATRHNLTLLSCIGLSLICTSTTLGCTSVALVGAERIFSCLARAERAAVLLRDTGEGSFQV